jgi:hypothetical protein
MRRRVVWPIFIVAALETSNLKYECLRMRTESVWLKIGNNVRPFAHSTALSVTQSGEITSLVPFRRTLLRAVNCQKKKKRWMKRKTSRTIRSRNCLSDTI